jgi:integrase
VVTKAHERRFKRRREPRYGSINKGFTELELQRFLRSIHNDKFHLLFSYQAQLGLRVGEVCKLHVSNIDFDKRELTIKSKKSKRIDALIIPLDLFKETVEYIASNEARIRASNGYVFFKDNDNNRNKTPHLDVNYVRKVFGEILKAANMDQVYAYSEETDQLHKSRPLYRLTTHSLRHYAITHFAKSANGNVVLASRFARHSNSSTTMRYIAKDKDELYKNIDYAFADRLKSLKENYKRPDFMM